uniref:glutamate-5-semialdehyde dehydrogenase n=1 Tax=Parolsenella massiliensis TaxID=1871022 RepID=UPI0009326819|nr:glutamate-5-semialdehyde dehydrogenase [Parolsenella massiliensis]
MSEAIEKATAAKAASVLLAQATAAERTSAILKAAQAVDEGRSAIIEANARDMERARGNGMPAPMLDRLMLDDERIDGIVSAMREVASQPDPIGEVVGGRTLASGIRLTQVRVPLGVIGMIYEARPNVTADAICLTLRTGNAVVLRGGSAALESCAAIVEACRRGISGAGLPADCVSLLVSEGHEQTIELMHAEGLLDLIIPRGGHSLIRTCVEQSSVPVIQTGEGNCHVYVHAAADLDMALRLIENAKVQRPGVCNAIETVLVDEAVASEFLPRLVAACSDWGVLVHGDHKTTSTAENLGLDEGCEYAPATEADWATEYDALELAVRVVSGLDEAISHINTYGTQHSECIVTSDVAAADAFLARVDAAAVYVNASTRFTDGGMFGLGAEIGISTQKLHARGPMGALALTTTKCLLRGEGQVRA